MFNDIKKLLRIKDPNIKISEVNEEIYKGVRTLVIYATLSPDVSRCQSCGLPPFDEENGKQRVVKNGTKLSTIRFEAFNHMPLIMKLKKQKFLCRNCQSYSTAQTYFVDPCSFIANHVKFKIMDLLREKISMTFIAKSCGVSLTTVIRVLQKLTLSLPRHRKTLPQVLMVDEFRSHANSEDSMSFICADGKTGELVDVLPSRKLVELEKYFNRYDKDALNSVSYLVTDMNASYFELPKRVFKNAEVVIDRFHIVKHLNDAFNSFRVAEVKRLSASGNPQEAAKLKSNWRKLVKNREKLNTTDYKSWRSFPIKYFPLLTEEMMLERLLAFSAPLKEVYERHHDILYAFRHKDPETFFELLENLPETIDHEFKKKTQNLLKYRQGITNALRLPYSNGKIEARNTQIKTLKRVSYGFKNYTNMKTRIFLNAGLIKVK